MGRPPSINNTSAASATAMAVSVPASPRGPVTSGWLSDRAPFAGSVVMTGAWRCSANASTAGASLVTPRPMRITGWRAAPRIRAASSSARYFGFMVSRRMSKWPKTPRGNHQKGQRNFCNRARIKSPFWPTENRQGMQTARGPRRPRRRGRVMTPGVACLLVTIRGIDTYRPAPRIRTSP